MPLTEVPSARALSLDELRSHVTEYEHVLGAERLTLHSRDLRWKHLRAHTHGLARHAHALSARPTEASQRELERLTSLLSEKNAAIRELAFVAEKLLEAYTEAGPPLPGAIREALTNKITFYSRAAESE